MNVSTSPAPGKQRGNFNQTQDSHYNSKTSIKYCSGNGQFQSNEPDETNPDKKLRPNSTISIDGKKTVDETFQWLLETYPKAFKIKTQPLKIGIHKDTFKDLPSDITRTTLRRAINRYVKSIKYQVIVCQQSIRIDLNGNQAGVVSQSQNEFAAGLLKHEGVR